MEMAIPLFGLGLMYIINSQSKTDEPFSNTQPSYNELPNTDIPNINYPDEYNIKTADTDITSKLSNVNRVELPNGVYTDKYFNPVSSGNINGNVNGNSSASSHYHSLTGKTVNSSYFEHNNMVPFFGSHVRTAQIDFNANESVLDNMNGSGAQIITKSEQSPLFSPHENLQYAYGAPNNSDFYQSRVNVGTAMNNVKPFGEMHVGPGLGLGYTTEGMGGYNSGMSMREQWVDRGVDDLRVATKPKASGLSSLGREGPATSYIKNMGNIGSMEKNRPERSFDIGPDRLFTTTGVEKGQTLHSIPIDRFVNRPETTTDYAGGAGFQTEAPYITGEYMPSTNIELGDVPFNVANANSRGYANDADYGIKSKTAYPNNRSVNHQDSYYGMVGGAIGSVVAPILDALRPSRRQNTIGNLRPYQNVKSAVGQSYLFNPNDRPTTTIRETTENSKFNLNVNGTQKGAYSVAIQQPIHNERDTTTDFFYAGNSGAGERSRQPRPYDAEYNQRNNDNKSSTVSAYKTGGNMKLLNSDINMTGVAKDDYLKNTRAVNPNMPYQSPNMAGYGQLQGSNNGLFDGIQMERNTPDILSNLKNNPYAINMASQL
jgi:hypothetical protein